jgi:DNA uptake protein ComE-like DNA-binding protein
MPDLDRRRLAVLAVVAVVVAVFGLRQMGARGEPPSAADPAALPVQPAPGSASGGQVTVHVAGAVRDPGVYRLRGGQRVDDAVQRAGGATAKADLAAVNLAAPLEDGRQILVPVRAEAAPAGPSGAAARPVLPRRGRRRRGSTSTRPRRSSSTRSRASAPRRRRRSSPTASSTARSARWRSWPTCPGSASGASRRCGSS